VIWQKPDLIINLLGDLQNKTVADIGAGTGFFAFRLVSKAKKVIAIDIDKRFVDYMDSLKILELPENLQAKLEPRLAEPNDPHLKPGEADVILIVNTFMYIRNRAEYLKNLQKGMAANGKLIIIDFKKKRTPIGPPNEMRLPIHEVEEALYTAGFRNIETNDTALDYQYFVIAQK
jgi:SAM-dependent methyltransferase